MYIFLFRGQLEKQKWHSGSCHKGCKFEEAFIKQFRKYFQLSTHNKDYKFQRMEDESMDVFKECIIIQHEKNKGVQWHHLILWFPLFWVLHMDL